MVDEVEDDDEVFGIDDEVLIVLDDDDGGLFFEVHPDGRESRPHGIRLSYKGVKRLMSILQDKVKDK